MDSVVPVLAPRVRAPPALPARQGGRLACAAAWAIHGFWANPEGTPVGEDDCVGSALSYRGSCGPAALSCIFSWVARRRMSPWHASDCRLRVLSPGTEGRGNWGELALSRLQVCIWHGMKCSGKCCGWRWPMDGWLCGNAWWQIHRQYGRKPV